MTKQEQCYKVPKQKKNRLPKKEHKKYRKFLAQNYPMCQICGNNMATSCHHVVFGRFGASKDDRKQITVCIDCHLWCHEHKRESQEKYKERAKMNWEEYCEIV